MLKLIRNLFGADRKESSQHAEREALAAMRSRSRQSAGEKPETQLHTERRPPRKPRKPAKKTVRDKSAPYRDGKNIPEIIEHKKKIPPRPENLIIFPELPGKTRFTDLALHQEVLYGVQEMGFEYCTPIQAESLPFLLDGRDTAGKAQTGTGKTAAFLAAIFSRFLNDPRP
ncbi:MAG: DEAD/DEAH box helicase, partial [Victivallales bacterium]|nr:DEAD/DEAH box helicase [Victivallales bacterium]